MYAGSRRVRTPSSAGPRTPPVPRNWWHPRHDHCVASSCSAFRAAKGDKGWASTAPAPAPHSASTATRRPRPPPRHPIPYFPGGRRAPDQITIDPHPFRVWNWIGAVDARG